MAVVVLGIGNILLSDEGVGVHTVGLLEARYCVPDGVELVDGGTAGMDLLNTIADAEALIIIDCAELKSPPGTVRRISGPAVPAFFHQRISPHQIGLSDLLAGAALIGVLPERLTLIAIQPESLELGTELTATGRAAAALAVDYVVAELQALGLAPAARRRAA